MQNKDTIVAIHQPNYFPWLGFFYKIIKSNVFILLDDVAYPKSGSSMSSVCNRTSIIFNQQKFYLSCPVNRERGIQKIKNIKIKSIDLHKKNVDIIRNAYYKAPFYKEISPLIEEIYNQDYESLSLFNINFIKKIVFKLDIKSIFFIQSNLNVAGKSTNLLIDLIKSVKGNGYLAGQGGSKKYLNVSMMNLNNIKVDFIEYPVFKYNQIGINQYIPGLSIIDSLMNQGFLGTKKILYAN